jgi:hypothetical protein
VTIRFVAALALAAMLLSGCATQQNVANPAALASIGPPPAGQARIVILRPEKGFALGDRPVPVKIDGEPMGDLVTGGQVFKDRPAGRHQLTAEFWDMPGVSRHDFNAASGQVYYFAVKVQDKVNAMTGASVAFGMVGFAATALATNDGTGPIQFIPMSAAAAKEALAAPH